MMKNKLMKMLSVAVAAVMVLSMAACGGGGGGTSSGSADGEKGGKSASSGDTYTLTFSTHLPETGIDGSSLKYFMEEVTEATDGRVQFDMYFGGSMTKSSEVLEAVSSGMVDLSFVPEGFFETEFYPTFVATLPYSTTSEWVCNKALKEMFDTYEPFQQMCDQQNVVCIGPVVPSELVMVSTKKEIHTLDDMKGLKIRAMGAVNQEMSMLGATPVAMEASEIYEALERDTVEAATGIPVTLAVSYKLQEIADNFIFSGIGTYTTSSLYMNKNTWDSLPADIQEAFSTVYDRFIDEYSGEDWMGGALKDSVQAIEDAGGNVVVLDAAERAKWQEKLADCESDFISTADSYGYDGQEILDTYRALVEKYKPDDIAYQLYE